MVLFFNIPNKFIQTINYLLLYTSTAKGKILSDFHVALHYWLWSRVSFMEIVIYCVFLFQFILCLLKKSRWQRGKLWIHFLISLSILFIIRMLLVIWGTLCACGVIALLRNPLIPYLWSYLFIQDYKIRQAFLQVSWSTFHMSPLRPVFNFKSY